MGNSVSTMRWQVSSEGPLPSKLSLGGTFLLLSFDERGSIEIRHWKKQKNIKFPKIRLRNASIDAEKAGFTIDPKIQPSPVALRDYNKLKEIHGIANRILAKSRKESPPKGLQYLLFCCPIPAKPIKIHLFIIITRQSQNFSPLPTTSFSSKQIIKDASSIRKGFS